MPTAQRHAKARRHNHLILAGLAVLLAAAIAAAWLAHEPRAEAQPALWHIAKGDRQGWLFGTIHAVPRGANWLSPEVEKAAAASDVLVLEASDLAAERSSRAIFNQLGRAPGLAPVEARIPPDERNAYAALRRVAPAALQGIDDYEDWAAALVIGAASQSVAGASGARAPEAQLEAIFRERGRPVMGLETVRDQLGQFDRLPPAEQQAMLAQSIIEASQAARLFDQLYASWAAGDLAAIEADTLHPLDAYPALRTAVLDRRNTNWARTIDNRLGADGRVWFIAVGTAHLIGESGLPRQLARDGWTVERVQ